MNEKGGQYIAWLAVIVLLVLPPFLVRSVADDSTIRLFGYFILSLAITGFFLYYLLSKTPLTKGSVFEKNFANQGRRNAEYLIRICCAIAVVGGLWMIIGIVPSLITYKMNPSTASVEVHTISHIDSAAVPGAFYVHMGIGTDDGKHLSYWYPTQVLQTGSRYSFTLLPNSDFVLKAESTK
jgi:hypothetical protein